MFGSDFWSVLSFLQTLALVAFGLLTVFFCVFHRRLSPWLYVIAFGLAGGSTSSVPYLVYTVSRVLSAEANFPGEWMQWMFGLAQLAGTAGRLLIFGGLVGFILDIRRQLAMFHELQEDLKDGKGKPQSGRRGNGD